MERIARFGTDDFEDPLSDYEPLEYSSELEWALAEEPVRAITARPFLQVRPTASVRQAVQAMAGSRSASLLVVDGESVVGIFTERDVLEKVAEQYDRVASHPVSEFMTSDPAVVYEDRSGGGCRRVDRIRRASSRARSGRRQPTARSDRSPTCLRVCRVPLRVLKSRAVDRSALRRVFEGETDRTRLSRQLH